MATKKTKKEEVIAPEPKKYFWSKYGVLATSEEEAKKLYNKRMGIKSK